MPAPPNNEGYMPGPVATVVIPAAISGVASLLGANKNSGASRDASRMQSSTASRALAEQRRIFDMQYGQEQKDRESRLQTFAQYGNTQKPLSGNLPNPYGMSDQQTSQMRNSFGQPQGGPQAPPQGPPPPQGAPAQPPMPQGQGPAGPQGQPPAPAQNRSQAMGSTVWLQAPTGETMQASLEQALPLIQKGALMIPAPTGQMGRG